MPARTVLAAMKPAVLPLDSSAELDQNIRRRRRRRQAAGLIVTIAVAIWWNWPRGDERFVGDWGLYRANRDQPSFLMRLHRNGGGWCTHLANGKSTRCKWEVNNEILTIGYGNPGSPPALLFRAQGWLQTTFGWRLWIIWAEEWRVLEIDRDTIRIRPASAGEVLEMRRIELASG
ncbi:hypothetical protein [Caulifigura coniformis]|nr:hypothetical protein [Caulifigura coniformis]